MTSADYLILIMVFGSLLLGIWRGMVYELLGLLSWFLAFYMASHYAARIMHWMPTDNVLLHKILAFVLIFVLVLMVVRGLAMIGATLVRSLQLGVLDSALGGLFGFARGTLLVCVLAFLLDMTPLANNPRWQYAVLRPTVEQLSAFLLNMAPMQNWTQPAAEGEI